MTGLGFADAMEVARAIRERRTIRRFKRIPLSRSLFEELVDGARRAPSGSNLQPLKYLAVDDAALARKVFPLLRWAAYIAPAGDPPPRHRPAGYIVVLADKKIRPANYQWETGAAVQNILLAAWEKGVGGCWLLSVDRPRLRNILRIPDRFVVDSVVALGVPDEQPVAVEMKKSVKYWKDKKGVLRVPKRKLSDVLFWNSFSGRLPRPVRRERGGNTETGCPSRVFPRGRKVLKRW